MGWFTDLLFGKAKPAPPPRHSKTKTPSSVRRKGNSGRTARQELERRAGVVGHSRGHQAAQRTRAGQPSKRVTPTDHRRDVRSSPRDRFNRTQVADQSRGRGRPRHAAAPRTRDRFEREPRLLLASKPVNPIPKRTESGGRVARATAPRRASALPSNQVDKHIGRPPSAKR